MYLGDIGKIEEDAKYIPEAIKKAVDFLKKADLSKMEKGKHPIDGEKMFVILDEYRTKPKSVKKAEMHRKYIDVQFIVSGKEAMGFGFEGQNSRPTEEYSAEKDVALYDTVNDETDLLIYEGMYAVFFPGEIHRPGCDPAGENAVRKAIVKVSVDLLQDR